MSKPWAPMRPVIITGDTFIRNLPYSVCKSLADELDPLGTATNWKDFVLKIPKSPQNPEPKYTIQHVRKFELVAAHGESPTMAIIESWATSNATVQNLTDVLSMLGLNSLVSMVQSRVTQPPSYDAAVRGNGSMLSPQTSLSQPRQPVQASSDPPQPPHPHRPAYHRQPTEHESLASVVDPRPELPSSPTSMVLLHGLNFEGNVSSYSYSSLQLVTSDFNNSLKLGEGAFGSVFQGHLSGTEAGNPKQSKQAKKIAIKRLKLDTPEFAMAVTEQFKKEVHVISELQHENILPLMGYSCDGPELCLVYDYMFNGSLSSSLESCRKGTLVLTVSQRLEIARGSACGISYLHDKKLIHRDIKSSNILLDSDMKPRISDFGLIRSTNSEAANQTSTRTANPIGTLVYMSPEACKGVVSSTMDVYSFGVVLLELLTGQAVVDENRDPSHLTLYIEDNCDEVEIDTFFDKAAGSWADGVGEAFYELSTNCMLFRRTRRPTMQKVFSQLEGLCEKEEANR